MPLQMAANDKLFEELRKYGIQDLHDVFVENGVDESIIWSLTKDDTKNELEMNFGQDKRYWETRKRKESEGISGAGNDGKLENSFIYYKQTLQSSLQYCIRFLFPSFYM